MVVIDSPDVKKNSLLHLQIKLLKLVFMWPINTCNFIQRVAYYLFFWFSGLALLVSSIVLLLKAFKTNDLVDRSEAIDIFTLTLSAFFKMVFFVKNHSAFKSLVDEVEYKYPLRPFFGKDDVTISHWMRYATPLGIIHYIGGFVTVTFWGMCPILNVFLGFTSFSDMPLPMNVWYPFDYSHGFRYFFLYAFHLHGLMMSGLVYMACDVFLFSLVHLSSGQIELLKASLRGIEDNQINGNRSIEDSRHLAFNQCVKHHTVLLNFLKRLDALFRSMIAADVMHAFISLSFAMFQASEAKGVLSYIKMTIFVGYCFIHQYLNSAFGQSLINQQNTLLDAVYDMKWVDGSISFRKSVLIMMSAGCSVPIRLSAWRMYFLQYETFVEFCRSMISFFMFLRKLQDQRTSG